MYSTEQRRVAVETFIKLDHGYVDTVAELGCPTAAVWSATFATTLSSYRPRTPPWAREPAPLRRADGQRALHLVGRRRVRDATHHKPSQLEVRNPPPDDGEVRHEEAHPKERGEGCDGPVP